MCVIKLVKIVWNKNCFGWGNEIHELKGLLAYYGAYFTLFSLFPAIFRFSEYEKRKLFYSMEQIVIRRLLLYYYHITPYMCNKISVILINKLCQVSLLHIIIKSYGKKCWWQ